MKFANSKALGFNFGSTPDGLGGTVSLNTSICASNDPNFAEKVVDVVGLYLNPLEHAVVLCVDRARFKLSIARRRACRCILVA